MHTAGPATATRNDVPVTDAQAIEHIARAAGIGSAPAVPRAQPVPVNGSSRPRAAARQIPGDAELKTVKAVLAWVGGFIGLGCLGVAALGAIDSYSTVRKAGIPWLGVHLAWTLPVVTDVAIFVLLSGDLLVELLARHDLIQRGLPFLRWVAWLFVAFTLYLNTSAAAGNPRGIVAHAVGPVAFVVMAEGVRMVIRRWTRLAGESTFGERIAGLKLKWVALFGPRGFRLWRRTEEQAMLRRYLPGVRLEKDRLVRKAAIRDDHGRGLRHWPARRAAMRVAAAAAALGEPQPRPAAARQRVSASAAPAMLPAAAGRTHAPASAPAGVPAAGGPASRRAEQPASAAAVPAGRPGGVPPRPQVPASAAPAILPASAGRTQAPPSAPAAVPPAAATQSAAPDRGAPDFTELAGDLYFSMRAAAGEAGRARVHELLVGRDDYAAIVCWLARRLAVGDKRLMALVALYAAGGRTGAGKWISGQVPGPAGRVDKNEIRAMAERMAPVWQQFSYPPQPAAG